jgi:hypothetical protein
MGCPNCSTRRLVETVEDHEDELIRLARVERNQGIAIMVLLVVGVLVVGRLHTKGILSVTDLLGSADG